MGAIGQFRLSNFVWWCLIPPGLFHAYTAATDPAAASVPQALFWWVKDVAAAYPALFPWIWKIAVALHVLEALYVLVKAVGAGVGAKDTALWFAQTLILGGPSTLPFLKSIKKQKKSE